MASSVSSAPADQGAPSRTARQGNTERRVATMLLLPAVIFLFLMTIFPCP